MNVKYFFKILHHNFYTRIADIDIAQKCNDILPTDFITFFLVLSFSLSFTYFSFQFDCFSSWSPINHLVSYSINLDMNDQSYLINIETLSPFINFPTELHLNVFQHFLWPTLNINEVSKTPSARSTLIRATK